MKALRTPESRFAGLPNYDFESHYLDIDGLRPDVFRAALEQNQLPNISRILGRKEERLSRGLVVPATAPAPSITFCSQACLFTGAHPQDHGIPGNQFFDRFGTNNNAIEYNETVLELFTTLYAPTIVGLKVSNSNENL